MFVFITKVFSCVKSINNSSKDNYLPYPLTALLYYIYKEAFKFLSMCTLFQHNGKKLHKMAQNLQYSTYKLSSFVLYLSYLGRLMLGQIQLDRNIKESNKPGSPNYLLETHTVSGGRWERYQPHVNAISVD